MIRINGEKVAVNKFPAGEQRLNFRNYNRYDENIFSWYYESDEELLTLYYLANHIKSHNGKLTSLYMPYCPNARMDRVKNIDEVFTLKYFCDIINSIGFEKIFVCDAHSDVCVALLNNCYNTDSVSNVKYLISMLGFKPDNDIIFYPDNGCSKRYEGKIKFPYLTGYKDRDWNTGNINKIEIVGKLPENPFNVLIVDDICSKGGTFLHSAKKLKEVGAQNIYLFVTHLENSVFDGEMIDSGLIDHIYTTGSIYRGNDGRITVID